MPPLPHSSTPRLVLYCQTHHRDHEGNEAVSLLPLITNNTGVTHVIIAAIHLNDGPGNITLNDHSPDHARFTQLWAETQWLKGSGVRVMGMLGGAAQGSFQKLSGDDANFEAYYVPLRDMIRRHGLEGLDLDIEEEVDISCPLRLLARLRADFGPDFILTLAPVATAMLPNPNSTPEHPGPSMPHLSGFHYAMLEILASSLINWYNVQFYCGWGDAGSPQMYAAIVQHGKWDPAKIVMGVVTNPGNGSGHVPSYLLEENCRVLRAMFPRFGGVMGWEYFNAGEEVEAKKGRPWEWVGDLGRVLRIGAPMPPPGVVEGGRGVERPGMVAQVPGGAAPPVPPRPSYPKESIDFLKELGFGEAQAVQALNMAGGNVDAAAGLLFDG